MTASPFVIQGWTVLGADSVGLHYSLGEDSFTEMVEFAPGGRHLDQATGLRRLLCLAAGVSYYKTVAPDRIEVAFGLTEGERALVVGLYDHGLREFAVENHLPVPRPIDVVADSVAPSGARVDRPPGDLALFSGGKDSLVTAQVLPDAHLWTLNPSDAVRRAAAALDRPLRSTSRRLDPLLFERNAEGALNGHVPITAVVTIVAAIEAWRTGLGNVVLSVERSASEPTGHVDGHPVNHQWAKSIDGERLVADAVGEATGGAVRVFSILRPFSEIAIGRALAKGDQRALRSVLSCNRAFTRSAVESGLQAWCGDCPKCRFVALCLAPFVPPALEHDLFGRDLLDASDQVEGFRDLWTEGRKPFECVGELDESAALVDHLAARPEWRHMAAVRAGADDLAGRDLGPAWQAALVPSDDHEVPADHLRLALEWLA